MYRIGNGIDFHRLEVNPNRPLVLGGVECESEV
ncbi:2-C-methyl-D-erythritol 2,4-cyclodiphosphate synthase, partial [Leptospira interrogans serovar Pomona]|nr:2-C-methyl-D-erythritol 2,4-cyclodiphosphate synthase [Leptospira interrogans serovar Pomona]